MMTILLLLLMMMIDIKKEKDEKFGNNYEQSIFSIFSLS